MQKNYVESLPIDYFDNIYQKVKNAINYEENTCISVMYGQSNKTIYKFLIFRLQKEKYINNIITYNQEVDSTEIVEFVRKKCESAHNKKIIFIIRFLENIKERRDALEKLRSIQDQNPNKIMFITLTDHSPLIDPESYSGYTTSFFLNFIYVAPFSFKQTKVMIETLKKYYKWKIPERCYKSIYNLSGGIARIVKYVCKEISDGKSNFDDYSYYINNIQINFELNYLKELIINTDTNKLNIIGLTNKSGLIKSRLLRHYFNKYRHKEVLINFPYLSVNESKILTYLVINKSSISVDKISSLMKMTDDNFSLWAIYKIMSRLKNKVASKYTIKTIKNFGYIVKYNK
ncbi:MAG: hypothetical protein QY322_04655 [bacterium]|nr:MAG: hypothetical protein QY322_04655 [bacterium]